MKKIISLISIILTLSTLLCSCNDDVVIDEETNEERVTQTTEGETIVDTVEVTTELENTEKYMPYVDVDGKLTAVSTHLKYMDLSQFSDGSYKYRYAQGGVVVGNYIYTCMVTDWFAGVPFRTSVVKTDLETGIVVAKSAGMELGVSNDATYVPDNNTIVVCDNGINGDNIVHILNADTLQLKRSVSLVGGTQAITYDSINKRYICYKYVGNETVDLYIYSTTFRLVNKITGIERTKSQYDNVIFNWQGIHTDGTYLYVLEWHGGSKYYDNITIENEVETKLRIIELSTGRVIDRIDLGFKREPEYIGFVDEKFYVACNNIKWTGMELYEVKITTEKN